MITIYGLYDPANEEECRYVGRTKLALSVRLSYHLRGLSGGNSGRKAQWVQSLIDGGRAPIIRELCSFSRDNQKSISAEGEEVNRLLQLGHRLTNDKAAGGVSEPSPSHRKKISEATKRQFANPAMRETARAAQQRRYQDPEEVNRLQRAYAKWLARNPDAHAQHSKRMRALLSDPAARKKISDGVRRAYESQDVRDAHRDAQRARRDRNRKAKGLPPWTPEIAAKERRERGLAWYHRNKAKK